jgi:PHP family Zn ribbon phosphoesterase
MVKGCKIASKKNWEEYYKIVNQERSEYYILLDATEEELLQITDNEMADVILKNRKGEIEVKPGYDGEYGVPIYGDIKEKETKKEILKPKEKQMGLGEF